jgi:hypothetical protein
VELEKYSIGIGDRFGFEGAAQLRALQMARTSGPPIVPVWNKSNREHSIIGTSPADTRREAERAVKLCGWDRSYYVDADHIGLESVDGFLDSSDFFTIDVADYIGKPSGAAEVSKFLRAASAFRGNLTVPGLSSPLFVTDDLLSRVAQKYLQAVARAGKVYRHIESRKGRAKFITEISLDEADSSQTPAELLFILAAVAWEEIPLQTLAPKFSGAFLKGVDYVGDVGRFRREFQDDLAVLAFAVTSFDLPANLKLSVHSGSDKFSLYPVIHELLTVAGAGLHIKTAGTTWLEEVVGLAEAGGDGLELAKLIYAEALRRYEELCAPYRSVVNIDVRRLPDPELVQRWSATEFVETLQHNPASNRFNRDFRQLVHVGYKVAAEMDGRFTDLLRQCRGTIEANVTQNLFERHLRPLFLGGKSG